MSAPASERFVDFLREWQREGLRIALPPGGLEPTQVRTATTAILRSLGEGQPRKPKPHDLETTLKELREAWTATRSIDGVAKRHLRRAPWVLFLPAAGGGPSLASEAGFIERWLHWAVVSLQARAIVVLLREFLRAYPQRLPTFHALREGLALALRTIESPRTATWHERCQRYQLLDSQGPVRMAEQWLSGDETFDSFLEQRGLSHGLEVVGFSEAVAEQVISDLRGMLRLADVDPRRLSRGLDWLAGRPGGLRFDALRVELASSLLSPFVERSPRADVQERLRAFLCAHIGDPRTHRVSWAVVPEEHVRVLYRWLVRLSLDDFFRVLDRTAKDEHWRYRKAFWTAYLEREFIQDAWVVLGNSALQLLARSKREEAATAARLRAGMGAEGTQSVLLMRIENTTIAEWSHNGKCRIWLDGNEHAPTMYAAQYSKPDLTNGCDFEQMHKGSQRGSWQWYVADWIARNTGRRVSQHEYMP